MEKQELQKNYDEIIDFLKKEKYNIFHSRRNSEEGILPEINWDIKNNSWNDFFSIAKKEGVSTIISETENFSNEDIKKIENIIQEKIEEEPEMVEELNGIFKDLKKHKNELGTFIFSWIKDGARYSFTEKTPWFEELEINLEELQTIAREHRRHRPTSTEEREEVPEAVSKKPVEELVEEYYNYILKEFPNASRHDMYNAERVFWQEKGVDKYITGKGRILIDKVSNLVERKLEVREREMLPKLIEECIKWCKEIELNKLTKSNVLGFLAEKEMNLSGHSKDILYNRVNIKLKQM